MSKEAWIARRARHLTFVGLTTPVATQQAKREWDSHEFNRAPGDFPIYHGPMP